MCYFEITHIMVHIMSSETRAMCCFTLTNATKCLHLWIKYSPRNSTFKCALCKSIKIWPRHRHPKPLSPPAWITALPSVTLVPSFWKKHQWTLISPLNWLCLCLGPFEVLDGIQVLSIVLWRCNLKPIKFSKNFPIDFAALQTGPKPLVVADVPIHLLFLSSIPGACLTCRDSPRCSTVCLPGLSDKIF